MAADNPKRNAQSGFALIVVLSGLAILTAIFAITTNRTSSQLQSSRTDELLISNQHARREILQYVLQQKLSLFTSEPAGMKEIELSDDIYQIQLQDVGGLIDLNTASPTLIQSLVLAMGLSENTAQEYLAWRAEANKLMRVPGFLTITGADHGKRAWLLQVATVHSGRSGISAPHTPFALLDLLNDVETHVMQFQSPPSKMNYNVYAIDGKMRSAWLLGAVHFGPEVHLNRILWINF